MTLVQKICLAITILGGINWGLIGLVDFNFIEALFGYTYDSIVPRIIYGIIGLTALINIGILLMDLKGAD